MKGDTPITHPIRKEDVPKAW